MGKHIKTVARPALQSTVKNRGCGECQTSCQSACKTSLTVSNQVCKKERR
ncbi:MAG: six-cysteine ranthipeptide SCIFF [Bacillota bacterium]